MLLLPAGMRGNDGESTDGCCGLAPGPPPPGPGPEPVPLPVPVVVLPPPGLGGTSVSPCKGSRGAVAAARAVGGGASSRKLDLFAAAPSPLPPWLSSSAVDACCSPATASTQSFVCLSRSRTSCCRIGCDSRPEQATALLPADRRSSSTRCAASWSWQSLSDVASMLTPSNERSAGSSSVSPRRALGSRGGLQCGCLGPDAAIDGR